MKPRTRRALAIVAGLATLGVASALVLNAFQSNLVFFFSPSQIAANEAPRDRNFRIGGLVEEGSLKRDGQSLTVNFVVTDMAQRIPVSYTGMLPDLFKEGKGVVAQGKLGSRRRVPRRAGAGQARRELHAARSRRGAGKGAPRPDAARAPQAWSEAMIPEIGHFALILALTMALEPERAAAARRGQRQQPPGSRWRGPRRVASSCSCHRLRLPDLGLRHRRLLGRCWRRTTRTRCCRWPTSSPRCGATTKARCCCGR